METEVAVTAEVQSGVQAGDEHAVAQALRAHREKKIEAVKPKKEIQKPEAKTEPKGQPEPKAEDAEPTKPTAISEEQPKPEAAATEEPKAVVETKPEEPKEPPRYKVVFDGKEEEVTVDELRSGYMRRRDYTLKTQELAKEREAFSAEKTQREQVLTTTLDELGALAQHMVQRLVDDDQRTDWNQLKQTDPEAYAVKVAERAEKRELLRTVLAKANEVRTKAEAEQAEKQQAEYAARLKEEQAKLAMVIPEWSDPERAKTGKAELGKYLLDRSFTKEEVGSLMDHRLVALAYDAMRYQRINEAKKKAEGEKKVEAKAPANPAAPAPEGSGNATRFERLKSRFQKTGDLRDAAKLMAERRKTARK